MQAESGPLISVIMPAYNVSRYIADSIESVVRQTYPNWELLVINDGSTDNTGDVVKSFIDDRIRYFEKANGGVSSARNLGLDKMRGDLFCFLDADDQLPDYSLEARGSKMQAQPETDIMDGGVMIMDGKMYEVDNVYWPSHTGLIANLFIRVDEDFFFGPNLMIRNRNINCRFNEQMTHLEDLWFYTELAWKNKLKYDHISDVVYHYRRHGGSAMSSLRGIENGFHAYYKNVKDLPGVKPSELKYLRKRIRRIMFRSYLRKGNVFRAFTILKRYL